MSEHFFNPFHFVPVEKPTLELLSRKTLGEPPTERGASPHVTHDRYVVADDVYSGRIVCKLKLETPTVLGARRDGSQSPALVEPYEVLGERDGRLDPEPAIPETSLRGMISSVFESVSNSAPRVLTNTPLSVRARAMKEDENNPSEALQAVGMVHVDKDGHRWVLPLAFPALADKGRGEFEVPPEFHPFENTCQIKIYLNNQSNRDSSCAVRPVGPAVYYLRTNLTCEVRNHRIRGIRNPVVKGGLVASRGQDANNRDLELRRQSEIQNQDAAQFAAGLLRNLGSNSSPAMDQFRSPNDRGERSLPPPPRGSMRHQWFIPLHELIYDPEANKWVYEQNKIRLIDAETAAHQFEKLAEQRTLVDLRLPYEQFGSLRNDGEKSPNSNESHLIKLRHGDLVCFDLARSGDVRRLAISSIWRKPTKSVWEWFQAIDPNLVPMNSQREHVTLAEQLFGFVQGDKLAAKDSRIKALAGRVRFSAGRVMSPRPAENTWYEPEGTTPILSAPKPPSPLLYFRDKASHSVAVKKADLTKRPESVRPIGRKWYLHHEQPNWKTIAPDRDQDQKTRLKPLRSGLEFVFDVDFTNLSETELALMVYSLYPTAAFRHRLGLGKPLGLGTVWVQPIGLFFIDRRQRCAEDDLFDSTRYHRVAIHDRDAAEMLKLPQAADDVRRRYEREAAVAAAGATSGDTWNSLHEIAVKRLENLADIRATVEKLGDPALTAGTPVHYPRLPDELLPPIEVADETRPDTETRLFQWHVWNEARPKPQSLRPLTGDDDARLSKRAPFRFFLYSHLGPEQLQELRQLLAKHYPGQFHPETGPPAALPREYDEELRLAKNRGEIAVHLGVEKPDDAQGYTHAGYGPLAKLRKDGTEDSKPFARRFRESVYLAPLRLS